MAEHNQPVHSHQAHDLRRSGWQRCAACERIEYSTLARYTGVRSRRFHAQQLVCRFQRQLEVLAELWTSDGDKGTLPWWVPNRYRRKRQPGRSPFSQATAVTIARDKTNRLYGDLLGSGVFRCRNASWRRILLTQPLCTSVLMEIEVIPLALYTAQMASLKRGRTVRSHGITLGDLLNGMQELVLDIWKANASLRHVTDFDALMTWSVSEEFPADEVRDRAEEDWDTNDEDWAANPWVGGGHHFSAGWDTTLADQA